MKLVAAVDIMAKDKTVEGTDLIFDTDLDSALRNTKPDIVVDFTRPDVVMKNLRTILEMLVYVL